jgi:hypothetical protein
MAAPRPTARDYAILGQQPHAPTEACIIGHGRLTRLWDPRHRPPDEQPLWLAVQDRLDEALSLIYDAETLDGGEDAVAA